MDKRLRLSKEIASVEKITTILTEINVNTIDNGLLDRICMTLRILLASLREKDYLLENNTGELSDGYHTFNELYHHRAILFSVICNNHPELAWKSMYHDDPDINPMYTGMFIVGIETPEGQATYHYDIDPYWDIFKVKELPMAPKWDGHTPDEAIRRIMSLSK